MLICLAEIEDNQNTQYFLYEKYSTIHFIPIVILLVIVPFRAEDHHSVCAGRRRQGLHLN